MVTDLKKLGGNIMRKAYTTFLESVGLESNILLTLLKEELIKSKNEDKQEKYEAKIKIVVEEIRILYEYKIVYNNTKYRF